jgi:hypothetical protein
MSLANTLSETVAFARFLGGLPGFVRTRMSADDAEVVTRARLRDRAANFRAVLDHGVFRNPRSAYRPMFALARITQSDVTAWVVEVGLEATLHRLRDAGVHVTFEEFKGRAPIVRGGQELPLDPLGFDTPHVRGYFVTSSGGSTGTARRVRLDLQHLRNSIPRQLLLHRAEGGPEVPRIVWLDLPPAPGLNWVLRAAAAGETPATWYTSVWGGAGTSRRFQWSAQATVLMAQLSGRPIAAPIHIPMDRADIVARRTRDLLDREGRCIVSAGVSRLVRVALAARQAGLDLTGATFSGGGEPPTHAKVAEIEACGARFTSAYHLSEAGWVGRHCTASTDPNDQHLMRDHLAVIQIPQPVPGFDRTVQAFCYTTLLPSAPKLLLNFESDDYGILETRDCSCPWGKLGFTEHVRDIRSYRKLTGEGLTLVGSDMERIIEEVLPRAHGGSSLDYQLMEEEGVHGLTRFVLLVHPTVPLPEPELVRQTFLEAIAAMGAEAGHAHAILAQPDVLEVRRTPPRWTARGKLLPLHIARRPETHTGTVT